MKGVLPLPVLLFVASMGFSQTQYYFTKQWDARFGGNNSENLTAMLQTRDSGYILAGSTYFSDSGGDISQPVKSAYDYWVVKTDRAGNKLWDKRFGGVSNGGYCCLLYALCQTKDGGFLLGGATDSDSGNDVSQKQHGTVDTYDFWIVKTDSAGNKQWDERYGGSQNEELMSLQPTKDGGYILAGYTDSDSSGDVSQHGRGGYDYWMVKIDSAGNKQWDKRFGGDTTDLLYSIIPADDGGYLLGGSTTSLVSGDVSQPPIGVVWPGFLTDYWVVKTDSAGNKQWDGRYGGAGPDGLSSVLQTKDGGYMLAGITQSDSGYDISQPYRSGINEGQDYWILKIDEQGKKQWDHRYGGYGSGWNPVSVQQTIDGGYLLGGVSGADSSGDKSENNLGFPDMLTNPPGNEIWAVKIDSSGNKQWDKTMFTRTAQYDNDENGIALQINDSVYVFSNCTAADTGGYKTQHTRGYYDYWFLQLTAHPCRLAIPQISATKLTICPGDSVSICAPSGYNYYGWNTGVTGNTCIEATQAGDYFVLVADTNNCRETSNHIRISMYPSPYDSILVSGNNLSASLSSVQYQWYKNDSAISGATQPALDDAGKGFYNLLVTDSNNCSFLSQPVGIGITQTSRIYSIGGVHSLMICSDNTVTAWGYNYYGQLGNGATDVTPGTCDCEAPLTAIGLTDVVAVAASRGPSNTTEGFSLALKSDGTVWSWGGNYYLGDTTRTVANYATPTKIPGLSGIVAIAAGTYDGAAVKNDGTVWGWGGNTGGELGFPANQPISVPVRLPGLTSVSSVAIGLDFLLALKANGTVVALGDNDMGQLGDSTSVSRDFPKPVKRVNNVIQVAAGDEHSVALRNDSTIWCWGADFDYQLGDGSDLNENYPEKLPDITNAIAVDAGSGHTVALLNYKPMVLAGSGLNTSGELENNPENTMDWVTSFTFLKDSVISVAAGGFNTGYISNMDSVYIRGIGDYGQLANGNIVNVLCQCGVATVNASCPVSIPTSSFNITEDKFSATIYPNPATNILNIEALGFIPSVTCLYTPDGRKIKEQKFTTQIDVGSLAEGLYILELYGDGGVIRKKFMKM